MFVVSYYGELRVLIHALHQQVSMKARVRCVFYLLLRQACVQSRENDVWCSAVFDLCVSLFMERFST